MEKNETYVYPNENFVDLTLYQYGMEQCPPLLSCGPSLRNHYLMHFIISGKGTFKPVSGIEYKLTQGQAFLIYPNNISFYCADETDPWKYIWIEFDGLKASTFLTEAGFSTKRPIYTPIANMGSKLKDYFFFLIEHHDASSLELVGTLYFILSTLIKTSTNKNPTRKGNLQEFYVREAVNYIEQNYNKSITIEDVANWCNLNRSYFGKLFKDTVLVSPSEFLIKYRLNKACDLLKQTEISILDVAEQVGYPNPFHFSRAFKGMFGMSPREWRKRNKL